MKKFRTVLDKYFIKKPKLREAVTKLIYGSKNKCINLFGIELTVNCLAENGYLRASKKSRMNSTLGDEVGTLISLASILREHTIFVDAGANIGLFASNISKIARVKSGLEVHAFEVDPLTFNRLEKNATKHGFQAYNMGLSDHNKDEAQFIRGAVSHVTTALKQTNRYSIPGRTFSSKIRRLDEIPFPRKHIFLKIDVEGQETAVIEGAKNLFQSDRIYGVYFDGMDDPCKIQKMMKNLGFSLFNGRTLRPAHSYEFSLLALRI